MDSSKRNREDCKFDHVMEFEKAENGTQVFICINCGKEMIEHEDSSG